MPQSRAEHNYEMAVMFYRMARYDDAIAILDQLFRDYHDSRHIVYGRAKCLAKLGRFSEARDLYDQLVEQLDDPQGARLKERLEGLADTPRDPDFADESEEFEAHDDILDSGLPSGFEVGSHSSPPPIISSTPPEHHSSSSSDSSDGFPSPDTLAYPSDSDSFTSSPSSFSGPFSSSVPSGSSSSGEFFSSPGAGDGAPPRQFPSASDLLDDPLSALLQSSAPPSPGLSGSCTSDSPESRGTKQVQRSPGPVLLAAGLGLGILVLSVVLFAWWTGITMYFPPDSSVGSIEARTSRSGSEGKWKEVGPARGNVRVSPRTELRFVGNENLRDGHLAYLESSACFVALDLSGAKIGDAALDSVARLSSLRQLDLSNTNVTDAGLETLHGLSALKILVLKGTKATPKGVAALKKSLKDCTVDFPVKPQRASGRAKKPVARAKPAPSVAKAPAASPRTDNSQPAPPDRSIAFASIGLVGDLYVRAWGASDGQAWSRLGPAQGRVQIPKAKEVRLEVRVGPGMLKCLSRLKSDDLQVLDLSQARMNDAGLAYISGCTGLRELTLNKAKVTGRGLGHIAGFMSLKSLEMRDISTLDDGAIASLSGLKSLERLVLSNTPVGDDAMVHISRVTSLKMLDISTTRVGDRGLAQIGRLKALCSLRLGQTKVSGRGLGHLAPLKSLAVLDLSGIRLSDQNAVPLGELKQVKQLHIVGTQISDASLSHLAKLKQLEQVSLHNTLVTEAGCRELEKALPDCTVFWSAPSE
jgi:tetratricopeptide repeat protein/Leucine Rich Repeat (LRR) protein